jgi:hypothetical protein
MKTKILILILALFALSSYRLMASSPYSVSLHAGYGHNLTYGSMANFDVDAYMPVSQYFETQASLRLSTANTYAVGVQLRPKFALPVGEMYLEDRLLMNIIKRYNFSDFVQTLSVGYRMQYVNVQVGMANRIIMPLPYEQHSNDAMILEPFDAVYRVEAFVRPQTASWNISLCLSNMDNYQIERMWAPMFYLGSWYDINPHWRIRLSGKMKLAGMFHLNAHYYGAELRAGAEYRF